MGMWIVILLLVIGALGGSLFYLFTRFGKFRLLQKVMGGSRLLRVAVPIVIIAAMMTALTVTMSLVNAIICVLHLVLIWLICELVAMVVRKIRKKQFTYYFTGIAALVITTAYMAVGWYYAHDVETTIYTIDTEKNVGELKVLEFSDSHVGATFDGDGFEKQVEAMQKEQPDVVVIAGDFVDDGTSREDMFKSCEALKKFDTKYGVYFIYGNHDKGYYSEERRGWTNAELKKALTDSGVNILEDEAVLIDNRFYIIGRQDKSEEQRNSSRADMEQLVQGLDKSKYMIVLDHQPNDYKAEAASGVDLVLSGHTHGGQFFPINEVGVWMGANDKTYGHEKRDNTDFIVSSGIADWEIKFKTGCISEYVVVNVK